MYLLRQIILFSIFFVSAESAETPLKEPIDYAKLELNKKALLGSRWSVQNPEHIHVYHEFQITDMAKVDIVDMSIRVDFFMKQRWDAKSLELPVGLFLPGDSNDTYIAADEAVLDSVWSPDSFIPNARVSKILSAATGHSAVNIYPNKTIIYKARMYAILGCSFTFQWYPLDIQICDLVFESYKYSAKQVTYAWEERPSPVTALDGILLHQYDFFLPPMISTGTHSRWGLDYPNVKMTFKFERKLGNNIIQVFTPTILVVTLSFFSFWLGLDAVPGRISLLVTCILTLVTMHASTTGTVPPVHYVKMMDIWIIGCMAFVFGAICEFILIKYLKWRAQQIENAKEEREKYLKKNGLPATVFPPESRVIPPSNQNNISALMNLPNTVYPEYGHFQNYAQKRSHFGGHSSQKREVWQAQQALANLDHSSAGPPSYFPPDLRMAIYNQPHHNMLLLEPPPTARPIWVKIDRICRFLFPLLFAIFNASYWPVLLLGSAKQYQNVTAGTILT